MATPGLNTLLILEHTVRHGTIIGILCFARKVKCLALIMAGAPSLGAMLILATAI